MTIAVPSAVAVRLTPRGGRDRVGFADGFPLLIISQASLDMLNERLPRPVGIERFRPNIVVDDHKQTTVEGVYAVGDLVPGSQLAITSAADGAIAAIAIHKSLLPPARLV